MTDMKSRKVAVLATDGVEQVELTEPLKALRNAGTEALVIAPHGGQIQGMNHQDKGDKLTVDHEITSVSPEMFDALVLPGGVANPDTLRTDPRAVAFVRHFVQTGKPIAAICHGPWTLIEADGVRGRTVTSWPSLRTDLRNAGAKWEDHQVVRDGNLVTSRKPLDLPAFCRELVTMVGESGAQSGGRPNASV
jgi:protease I